MTTFAVVKTRDDVAAFEVLTRALVGISLESLDVLDGQVSLPQFRLLLTLAGLGRVPSTKLAGELRQGASAVTRTVDRLAKAGLVERGTDERNRSVVTLDVTERGRRLVTDVLDRRHEMLAAVLDRMSPEHHAAAVETAVEFCRNSDHVPAVGAAGPLPL
ncbi:MarR family transcriptional regulator [Amycolatopsis sp. K13G38]|uniref:MarR family transcriptional regulator n=1 Tax=Amycolatopsis acididurans TaxID=2724524 RepID=A0ABX1J815_9PSEU|nr:MarR family transcriptional regulator [Amycolatopsis acididurans]